MKLNILFIYFYFFLWLLWSSIIQRDITLKHICKNFSITMQYKKINLPSLNAAWACFRFCGTRIPNHFNGSLFSGVGDSALVFSWRSVFCCSLEAPSSLFSLCLVFIRLLRPEIRTIVGWKTVHFNK